MIFTSSSIGAPSPSSCILAAISASGLLQSRWYIAPISRARPTMDRLSGRLGVISKSSTVSPSLAYSANGMPTGASSGRIQMPS